MAPIPAPRPVARPARHRVSTPARASRTSAPSRIARTSVSLLALRTRPVTRAAAAFALTVAPTGSRATATAAPGGAVSGVCAERVRGSSASAGNARRASAGQVMFGSYEAGFTSRTRLKRANPAGFGSVLRPRRPAVRHLAQARTVGIRDVQLVRAGA